MQNLGKTKPSEDAPITFKARENMGKTWPNYGDFCGEFW
jgi:hypothetical protein